MEGLHSAPAERVASGARAWEGVPPLDPAKTAPFELPGRRPACLLVHGFTGTPWDVRPLGEALARAGHAVRAVRLPGHGTTPRAMLEARAPDWLLACDEALAELPGPKVAVAGLSLGALLALVLAARHPGRVAAVAALAPAVRFQDRQMNVLRRLRPLLPLFERIHPWIVKTGTDLLDPVARAEAPVLPAWPTARLRDLWELQELAWGAAARVVAPTLVMVAAEDHVVDNAGARRLVRRLHRAASVRHLRIENSAHILPRDRNGALVAAELIAFLARTLTPGGG
jgi:carboxylesterase